VAAIFGTLRGTIGFGEGRIAGTVNIF